MNETLSLIINIIVYFLNFFVIIFLILILFSNNELTTMTNLIISYLDPEQVSIFDKVVILSNDKIIELILKSDIRKYSYYSDDNFEEYILKNDINETIKDIEIDSFLHEHYNFKVLSDNINNKLESYKYKKYKELFSQLNCYDPYYKTVFSVSKSYLTSTKEYCTCLSKSDPQLGKEYGYNKRNNSQNFFLSNLLFYPGSQININKCLNNQIKINNNDKVNNNEKSNSSESLKENVNSSTFNIAENFSPSNCYIIKNSTNRTESENKYNNSNESERNNNKNEAFIILCLFKLKSNTTILDKEIEEEEKIDLLNTYENEHSNNKNKEKIIKLEKLILKNKENIKKNIELERLLKHIINKELKNNSAHKNINNNNTINETLNNLKTDNDNNNFITQLSSFIIFKNENDYANSDICLFNSFVDARRNVVFKSKAYNAYDPYNIDFYFLNMQCNYFIYNDNSNTQDSTLEFNRLEIFDKKEELGYNRFNIDYVLKEGVNINLLEKELIKTSKNYISHSISSNYNVIIDKNYLDKLSLYQKYKNNISPNTLHMLLEIDNTLVLNQIIDSITGNTKHYINYKTLDENKSKNTQISLITTLNDIKEINNSIASSSITYILIGLYRFLFFLCCILIYDELNYSKTSNRQVLLLVHCLFGIYLLISFKIMLHQRLNIMHDKLMSVMYGNNVSVEIEQYFFYMLSYISIIQNSFVGMCFNEALIIVLSVFKIILIQATQVNASIFRALFGNSIFLEP